MKNTASLLLFLCVSAGASVAVRAEPAAVEKSTATADWANVNKIYTAEKIRDPFIPLTGVGIESASVPAVQEAVNIHDLNLKGLMADARGRKTAILASNSGLSYLFRDGKLWDRRGRPIPGVSGLIQGKAVFLSTAEKDIQWLKMGEEQ